MSFFDDTLKNPFTLFTQWYEEAQSKEFDCPDAMTVASVGSDGFPSVRVVLMKDFSSEGFIFYTNLKSQKAQAIINNPKVCLNFHWKSTKKQVRITGIAQPVSDLVANQYFSSRPRTSQLGAWASKQSQEMPDRFALEKRVIEFTAKFGLGPIPRPEFWSGFCVVPEKIEFWHEKPYRLHERIVYIQTPLGWQPHRLFP
jgi:pyridoxamine 5'-phosphate oxidase